MLVVLPWVSRRTREPSMETWLLSELVLPHLPVNPWVASNWPYGESPGEVYLPVLDRPISELSVLAMVLSSASLDVDAVSSSLVWEPTSYRSLFFGSKSMMC